MRVTGSELVHQLATAPRTVPLALHSPHPLENRYSKLVTP